MGKIGLLGFGTVGSGVYEIINEKKSSYFADGNASIKRILVRDKSKKRFFDNYESLLTDNFEDIINDDEISTVIAVMGGMEPEYTYITRALKKGKNVVTANKEIVARHIEELLNLADENNVAFMFEASVAGGIPIIGSLLETLKINKVDKIQGILNGTTNFILTQMTQNNEDFDVVLKRAQDLGFAEADPTADIEGFDVLRKIGILASLSFGKVIPDEDIYRRGESNISINDIKMAEEWGYSLKYVAEAIQLNDTEYTMSVAPVLMEDDSVISKVNQEYNVVIINGNIIGELCFLGKGAGKDATANAVVSDLIKVLNGDYNYSHIHFGNELTSKGLHAYKAPFYLRANVEDYEQFNAIVNEVAKVVQKNHIVYENNKLYFKTEEISGNIMNELANTLKEISSDVFYARIANKLL